MTYFYEHVDGSIHRKPDIVVDAGGGPRDYFNSPFVKRWWHEEDRPRTDVAATGTVFQTPATEREQ